MKESFIRKPTKTTPGAGVNYEKGKVVLKGRSSPENTMEFFEPFLKAISSLAKAKCEKVTASFRLVYFNTSSARCIYLTIKELKKLELQGKTVGINWFAEEEDEDMIETGLDFQDMVGMDFKILKFSRENE
ncbi:DUF1987 domain-containing protein [Ekhidna sp.]|uniref:DUF1987 domain-containing protein n=1 Tax=Ekhidna sp. TaxID=2608089 RepID=UPI003CCBCC26